MNPISKFIKEKRKAAGLTQQEFAMRSGLGLRFVRELEQGKETVRMDKVNVALVMLISSISASISRFISAVICNNSGSLSAYSEKHMYTSGRRLRLSLHSQYIL